MISEANYLNYLHRYYQSLSKKEPNMALKASVGCREFPFCCGVRVLGQASITPEFSFYGVYDTRPSEARTNAVAKKIMSMIDPSEMGCYLYTTIASQKMEYNALKMAGFQILGKFKNPRSGNWVFLWAWMKAPLPSRTKTVAGPRRVSRAATSRRKATATRRLVRSR